MRTCPSYSPMPSRKITLASLAGRTNAPAPTRSVLPSPRRNQRHIHRLEFKLWLIRIRCEICLRGLQPILIVAVGEIWLVMGTARLVAHARALRDHSRQLQHVV